MDKKLKLIDTSTGEVIRELQEGDRIVTKKQQDFLNNTMPLNEDENFIKLMSKILEDLAREKLTSAEWQVVIVCLKHLSYYSGAIKFENNGNFVTPQDIAKESKLSKRSVQYCIEHLVNIKIFHKGKTGEEFQLFANPFIFMKGNKVNKTLYDMFKTSKWNKKNTEEDV
jgi:hypothetical protein